MKIQIYLLYILILFLFAILVSCPDGLVEVDTDPVPQSTVLSLSFGTASLVFGADSYTVDVALTNLEGGRVTNITEDFKFTATPPGAIIGISSNSNSYTFAVTNASYGSVTINAVHKQSNTLSVRQSFTLAKTNYSVSQIPIAFSATNTIFTGGTYLVSPATNKMNAFFPKYPLSVSINPALNKNMAFSKRPFSKRPFSKRPFSKRPFSKRPFSEHPFSEHPFSEHPFSEHPFSEHPFSEHPFSEHPFSEHPFSEHPFSEHPFSEHPFSGNPFSVSASSALPISISNDGSVYLTTGASVSTNKVTVTFVSSNYVDYTTSFYVQVHHASVTRAVFASSPSSPLTFGGGNYTVRAMLTNSDGSKVTGITEDFRFTASPPGAIVGISSNSTSYTFAVTNASYGSVTINAVHKQSNTLSVRQSFALAKGSYSASQIPIVFSATNTIFTGGTYLVSPATNKMNAFFPKYPLSISASPALPLSISNDGSVYLTAGASVSTNKVTVTFVSSNYVDYTTSFYVQVHHAPVARAVFASSPSSPLTFGGDNYTVRAMLTNSDGSKVTGIAEDFRFTASPPGAIVGISSNANSYTFAVTNASYESVTINAVHKQSNTLSVRQSFTLAKGSYLRGVTPIAYRTSNTVVASASIPGKVSLSSDNRANYYPQGELTISRVSGPDTYSFNANNGEITFTGAGSYEFQVTFASSNYATYTTPQFTVTVEQLTRFGEVVLSGSIPNLANETDELTRAVLTNLGVATGGTLVARYATENGAGLQNGTNWANAWAATDLRGGINGISDASTTKAYAVLVASGTYKPTDGTDRTISFSMKNNVAIIGGFASSGSWTRSGTTTFSGDIGAKDSTGDNSHQVFSHDSILLDNGLLYGATITKGNANGGSLHNSGGGMYNKSSSPRLVSVRFADNSAILGAGIYNKSSSPRLVSVRFANNSAILGAGMYNDNSSPRLVNVVFSNNSVGSGVGGGMYNGNSSPVLTGVEFAGNSAGQGGGMYNTDSFPVLRRVVFTDNSASSRGGGMYNVDSSPVLTGVVFTGNSATGGLGGGMLNSGSSSPVLVGAVFRGNSARDDGGGMYSYTISSGNGPVIVNSIFTSNSVIRGVGEDIAFNSSGSSTNINVRIAGSVLGTGTANATNGITVIGTGSSFDITYHSLAKGAVNFGADASTSATTGEITYPTIQSTSSALNIGLHVRRSGTTYYFSEDGTTWYTGFAAFGGLTGSANLPANTEHLTATDIAGNARVNRPDAGVHEYR